MNVKAKAKGDLQCPSTYNLRVNNSYSKRTQTTVTSRLGSHDHCTDPTVTVAPKASIFYQVNFAISVPRFYLPAANYGTHYLEVIVYDAVQIIMMVQ